MKVILIIFLSLFLIISILFIFTFISGSITTAGDGRNIAGAGNENNQSFLLNNSTHIKTGISNGNAYVNQQFSIEKNSDNNEENVNGTSFSTDQASNNYDSSEQEPQTQNIQEAEDKDTENKDAVASNESVMDISENNDNYSKTLLKEFKVCKIVYQSNRNGHEDIYSINLDGSALQRLTDNPGNDLYPEVSPDGNRIAYTADINGTWQIIIMSHDGSNKIQITNNDFRSGYPSWSFDGRYIYFEGFIDGDWELFRINSDGSNQARLTYNPDSHDWHPNGHPNENRVIYESGETGHENIFIMDHDGSDATPLFGDGHRRRTPDLSADCKFITYTKYFDDNSEVYYMDLSTGAETRITENIEWDGHPAFTPDDRYIVFEQNINNTGIMTLYELATGIKTTVTNATSSDSDGSALFQ